MTRANFTRKTKRQAHERSGGICECHLIPHVFERPCGLRLGDGNTFYEHITCDNISSDNSLENCAVLTRTCWSYKTNRYDKPTIAKSRRVRDRARGIRQSKGRTFETNRDGPLKQRMDGTVVRRI